MGMRFPNETRAYRAARERLLKQEIALRRATEDVAEARRALPAGGEVPEDYVFEEAGAGGQVEQVRLSDLFQAGRDTLVVYQMMFPRFPQDARPGPRVGRTSELAVAEGPCPSCTAFLDQMDGAAAHLGQRVSLVVVGKAPAERLRTFAEERGWRHLRLVSSGGNRFKQDYGAESAEGWQLPMMSVFERKDEVIRHFWSSEMMESAKDPGQDSRHNGTVEAIWNVFDLTRAGRPMDWQEQMTYGAEATRACCGEDQG